MAKDDLAPGLSDFGLSAPSESNSVGQDTTPLEQLLSGLPNQVMDDISQEQVLRSRMQELAAQEDPSFLDKLKSPEGIIRTLLTGGALAAGNPGLALGFGLGSAGELNEAVAADKAARRSAMDQLSERLDDNEERILKRQQMLQTAIQNAPDQFIDPETGELSAPPELLGYLAYGMPISANPSSKRLLNQRDERWDARLKALSDGLEEVSSVEDAAVLVGSLNSMLGAESIPAEESAALARAMGTDEWDTALIGHYVRNGGSSAKTALIFAGENDLPLTHPEVIKRLDFSQGADAIPPSQQLNARFIELMNKVREWERNPANGQLVSEIRSSAETPEEARRQIAEQALVNSADVGFYEDEMGALPSYVSRRLQAQYNYNLASWDLANTVIGARGIEGIVELDPESRKTRAANETLAELRADERAVIEDQAKTAVGKVNSEAGRIVSGLGASHEQATRVVQQAYSIARRELGDTATQADIEARVAAKVTAYIEKYKQQ